MSTFSVFWNCFQLESNPRQVTFHCRARAKGNAWSNIGRCVSGVLASSLADASFALSMSLKTIAWCIRCRSRHPVLWTVSIPSCIAGTFAEKDGFNRNRYPARLLRKQAVYIRALWSQRFPSSYTHLACFQQREAFSHNLRINWSFYENLRRINSVVRGAQWHMRITSFRIMQLYFFGCACSAILCC